MTQITKTARVTYVEFHPMYEYSAFGAERKTTPIPTRYRIRAEGPFVEVEFDSAEMVTPGQQVTVTITMEDHQ